MPHLNDVESLAHMVIYNPTRATLYDHNESGMFVALA